MAFCFCMFCQKSLSKSIFELETQAAGEEAEVKLRLNRLVVEYKKMSLACGTQPKSGREPAKSAQLSLSEKIMKGVINNLLLKSLNDSKDVVRVQTLNSLNQVAPDFVHFLVSSKWLHNCR